MSAPAKEPAKQPSPPGPRPGGGGPMRMFSGPPVERSLDFRGSAVRLLRTLRPDRSLIRVILVLGAASVALTVAGPKLLGHATDLVVAGVYGDRVDTGSARASDGIDFDAVGRTLLWAALVYVAAWGLGLAQARLTAVVVQRAVFRLREEVEAKLSRLPLSYFDRHQRGEILSRTTNDIDNVGQSLQQTMSQIVTSLLTIAGVLAVMFWISPLLALVALVTVPLSITVATRVGKRAQPQFVAQWASTGKLNAHIEEMYTGHSLVQVFGRRKEAAETFRKENDELFRAGYRAQFISGLIQPAMIDRKSVV